MVLGAFGRSLNVLGVNKVIFDMQHVHPKSILIVKIFQSVSSQVSYVRIYIRFLIAKPTSALSREALLLQIRRMSIGFLRFIPKKISS